MTTATTTTTITATATATAERAFFLYGTLQPCAGTRMGQWVAARLLHAAPASVPGRLHAVNAGGWFPALLPGCGRVRGTLCRLRLRPGERAMLDGYEGREYRRVALPVRTGAGRVVAEAYVWQGALPPGSPRLRGDFLAWLDRGGRRIFAGTGGALAH